MTTTETETVVIVTFVVPGPLAAKVNEEMAAMMVRCALTATVFEVFGRTLRYRVETKTDARLKYHTHTP